MMMRLHGPCAVVVALAACLAGGCTSLGERIAQPHSSSLLDAETVAGMESTIGVESATFRTPDGVLLAYGSIAPVARDMAYPISRGDSRMTFKFNLGDNRPSVPTERRAAFLPRRGLVPSHLNPLARAQP